MIKMYQKNVRIIYEKIMCMFKAFLKNSFIKNVIYE